LELDRNSIERRDFSAARRGYDPDEVDRHLADVADEVERLKRAARQQEKATPSSIATQAAEQVRGIIEAAERSASEIEERARAEENRITNDANRDARETREKADADAVERVRRAEEATEQMLERTGGVESELDGLLAEVRSSATDIVTRLRDGSTSLAAELTSMREEFAGVRGARLEATSAAATRTSQPAVEAEPELEEVEEPEAEAAEDGPAVEEAEVEEVEEEPAVEEEEEVEEEEVVEEEEEPAVEVEEEEEVPAASEGRSIRGAEGARLIALNMALNGTPRDETARYLSQNFDLDDQDALLDEVYARVGG
jgi:DivIVA domain-containing protein